MKRLSLPNFGCGKNFFVCGEVCQRLFQFWEKSKIFGPATPFGVRISEKLGNIRQL